MVSDFRVGVIGFGYWGPNIARNFSSAPGSRLVAICDSSPGMLARARETYPDARLTTEAEEIYGSADVDIVAVITPVSTHFELAKKALENGKHVFVEKPFTATSAQAKELISLAEKKGLKIMVDHPFLFTDVVRKIKELIQDGTLGDVYYLDSMRINLGLFQHDVNVVWDLAPHDFYLLDYLIDEEPTGVSATGTAHANGLQDIAYVTVRFANSTIAHFNVNWLSPVKQRTMVIGGSKKMVFWDDNNVAEKLKVYDKGIEVNSTSGIYDLLVSYRSGDVWIPKIAGTEALKNEASYFIKCLAENMTPMNDGYAGLKVVRMLEAADESLRRDGELIAV